MCQNDMRYIKESKNGKKYVIEKRIGEKIIYCGTYNSLRDAKFARDYFEKNNWNTTKIDKIFQLLQSKSIENISKYIHTDGTKYHIQKTINKKQFYFGRYDTLDDAIAARKYFIEHDWNPEDISKLNMAKKYNTNKHKFIQKTIGGYQLKKNINGKNVYFGNYSTLDEALTAREYFEKHGWKLEDRFKFTKPRKQPAEIELNKPYFESMRLV